MNSNSRIGQQSFIGEEGGNFVKIKFKANKRLKHVASWNKEKVNCTAFFLERFF